MFSICFGAVPWERCLHILFHTHLCPIITQLQNKEIKLIHQTPDMGKQSSKDEIKCNVWKKQTATVIASRLHRIRTKPASVKPCLLKSKSSDSEISQWGKIENLSKVWWLKKWSFVFSFHCSKSCKRTMEKSARWNGDPILTLRGGQEVLFGWPQGWSSFAKTQTVLQHSTWRRLLPYGCEWATATAKMQWNSKYDNTKIIGEGKKRK